MKLSASITQLTRKLHRAAINLHVRSLRTTIAVANAEARNAERTSRIATKVADAAIDFEQLSKYKAREAAVHAVNVKQAALIESVNIGGVL